MAQPPGQRTQWLDRLNDFSGGLSTSRNALLFDTKQSPRCLNVISRAKTRYLTRRPGQTVLPVLHTTDGSYVVTTETGRCNAMGDFTPVKQAPMIVAKWAGKIRFMRETDGLWRTLETGLVDEFGTVKSYTVASGTTSMTNYAIILSDATEKARRWNGTDAATRLFGSSTTSGAANTDTVTPIAHDGESWRNRFFFFDIDGFPTRIQWTNANSFTVASTNYQDVDIPGVKRIYTGKVLRNQLYLFTRDSIHKVTYLGSDPLLQIGPALASVGVRSKRTIHLVIYKGEEHLIFLGTDNRVYLFNGFSAMAISSQVDEPNDLSPYYMKRINGGAYNDAWAVADDREQLYHLCVPYGTEGATNVRFVADYSGTEEEQGGAISWWPWDNQPFRAGCMASDITGRKRLVIGTTTGGTFFANKGNTDDATTADKAIQTEWYTHKLSSQVTDLTVGTGVDFVMKRLGKVNSKVSYRIDFDNAFTTEEDMPNYSPSDTFLGGSGSEAFILGSDTQVPSTTQGTLGGPSYVKSTMSILSSFNFVEIRHRDSNTLDAWAMMQIVPRGFVVSAGYGVENRVAV